MNIDSSRNRISSADNQRVEKAGVSMRRKKHITPKTTLNSPSRMKIHRHPSRPPMPSILAMAAARRPEKAPDKALAQ
jgi:hypothetical protein